MSFGSAIQGLISSGHAFRIRGFFNVEGGQVGLSNKFHEWCDCIAFTMGVPKKCQDCGRAPGNYVSLNAGDGDGVYVVTEIVNQATQAVVGAFSIFDYGYEMANAVRSQIEQEKVPTFPIDLAMGFSSTRPAKLEKIENTGVVYFADGGSGIDARNAIVDVHIEPGEALHAFTFLESVSSDPIAWGERLSRTQGSDPGAVARAVLRGQAEGEVLFQQLEIEAPFSLPSVIPRVLLVLIDTALKAINLEDEYVVEDWALLGAQFAGSVGNSHAVVMNVSTVWMNALLAREWDRAAGENLDFDETKRLLFDSWTWAYQGAILDDDDCKRMISVNRYRATPEEVSDMLRRRGLVEEADKALEGDLPDIGDGPSRTEPVAPTGSPGLTKTGGGLGGGLGGAAEPTGGLASLAKFCVQCGNAFSNESAKFCSSCGTARG